MCTCVLLCYIWINVYINKDIHQDVCSDFLFFFCADKDVQSKELGDPHSVSVVCCSLCLQAQLLSGYYCVSMHPTAPGNEELNKDTWIIITQRFLLSSFFKKCFWSINQVQHGAQLDPEICFTHTHVLVSPSSLSVSLSAQPSWMWQHFLSR